MSSLSAIPFPSFVRTTDGSSCLCLRFLHTFSSVQKCRIITVCSTGSRCVLLEAYYVYAYNHRVVPLDDATYIRNALALTISKRFVIYTIYTAKQKAHIIRT